MFWWYCVFDYWVLLETINIISEGFVKLEETNQSCSHSERNKLLKSKYKSKYLKFVLRSFVWLLFDIRYFSLSLSFFISDAWVKFSHKVFAKYLPKLFEESNYNLSSLYLEDNNRIIISYPYYIYERISPLILNLSLSCEIFFINHGFLSF